MKAGRCVVPAAILMAASRFSTGQNLLDNPAFDVDTSSWTTSAFATWDGTQNHGNGESGDQSGSLRISTSTFDSAFQCTAVMPGEVYSLQTWIEEDPLREVDPCPTPRWSLQLAWFDDAKCQGNEILSLQKTTQGTVPLGWYLNSVDAYAPSVPQQANSVKITLGSICSVQRGTSTFYFDDVSFTLDRLFRNTFED